MRAPAIAVLCLALVAGCDKGQERAPSASGPTSADEAALFKMLPSDSAIVFGGNYMKLQRFMQSAVGDAFGAMGPGLTEWAQCWADLKDMKLAASVSFSGGSVHMQTVFTGATLDQMKTCADKAGFKATVDGGYLLLEMTTLGKKVEQGMLQLPGGFIYTRQTLDFSGGAGAAVPSSRAELEGEVARLAQGSVLDNRELMAIVEKVDRTKRFWFAGTAAGTPIGDKVGSARGTFDLDPGLTVDVTVQIVDSAIADKIMRTIPQAKKSVASIPADVRPVVENLSVTRDGDQLRAQLKLTDNQVAALLKQLATFSKARGL